MEIQGLLVYCLLKNLVLPNILLPDWRYSYFVTSNDL